MVTYFNCSGYNRGSRKICSSTHYIRTDFLEQVVLGEIKRLMKFATLYENEFAKIVMGNSIKAAEQRLKIHYNCIGAIEIPDLDKLPENNVSVHTRQGVDVHFAACAS